ncbi:P-loop containing nucleoside triphosphate hydrolase protein [Amanita muscaria]
MPSPRYANLLLVLLFTPLPNDSDLPECLYDDAEANELLGIKRGLPDNMSRLNLPTSVKSKHHVAFSQFLTVVPNMTTQQLKDTPIIGSAAQWEAWFSFVTSTLTPNMNKLVEKAMSSKKRHPVDLMDTAKNDEWCKAWSSSNSAYIANIVAEELLGEERLTSTNGQIVTSDLSCIVSQNYDRLRKNHRRLSSRLETILGELEKATAALFDDTVVLKVQHVRSAAIGVRKYVKATSLFPNARSKADEASAMLAGCMTQLGVEEKDLTYKKINQKTVENAQKRGRARKMDPADLADESAVQQIISLYMDFFRREDEELTLDGDTARELWDDACNDSGDMGVTDMKMKTEEELCNLLSFQHGRPINWNAFCSESKAVTAWDQTDNAGNFETGGVGMTELRLLWHQLVGVAAMADKAWQTKAPFGILLADEVGVGKTAQVMAFISFLQLVHQCEVNGQPRPPLLENRESFMGRGVVPNAPHAIIVPNTLVNQWRRELKCFFKPHAIDIFVLPTSRVLLQDYFKRDNSPWTKANHDEIFRVVLIPHSVFNTLTGMSFACDRRKPLDEIRRLLSTAPEFFSKQWCSAWIDEAHEFRTPTRSFIGAIQLRKQTRMMSCCTATPLFTKPQYDPPHFADFIVQDVVNLGRIIGVPAFLGDSGNDWEKDNARAWNRAQRAITKEDKLEFRQKQEDLLLNKSNTTETPTVSKEVQRLKLKYIKDIQTEYRDHIIRRTKESKRPDGRGINDLPPLTSTVIPVTLTPWEINILDQALGDVLSNRRNNSLMDINSEKFYIHYRLNIAYPVGSSEEGKNDFPSFNSLGEWEKRPGSKLSVLIRLLRHLLSDDEIEHVSVDGSDVLFPMAPQHEGREPTRSRKILIYYEYPMTTPSIQSAMNVNGIIPFVINGSMKMKDRDETVQAFVSSADPDRRVLLFSSVGAAGLNLACADVVILYDMVWSDQATVQIIGRAHRLGQTRPVHVYHLLAIGTTDVIISSMAREKNDMLQALLTRTIQQAPGLEDMFKIANDDDSDEEPEEPTKTKKKRPRATQGKKAAAIHRPSESVTPAPVQSTSGEGQDTTQTKIIGSPSETVTLTSVRSTSGEVQDPEPLGPSETVTTTVPPVATPSETTITPASALPPSESPRLDVPEESRPLDDRDESPPLDVVPDKGKKRQVPTPNESPPSSPLTPMQTEEEEVIGMTHLVASTSIANSERTSEKMKKRIHSPPSKEKRQVKRRGVLPTADTDDEPNPHIDLQQKGARNRRLHKRK